MHQTRLAASICLLKDGSNFRTYEFFYALFDNHLEQHTIAYISSRQKLHVLSYVSTIATKDLR